MEDIDRIQAFLSVTIGVGKGYGSGYGSGYGYSKGYGPGYGYAYGYGNGDGDGDGSSYGYAHVAQFGAGDGSGNGYGNGSGDGDGNGDGNGDGGGIKSINGEKIWAIDSTPTIIRSVHRNYARGAVVKEDLTLAPCYIAKVGDFFAHGKTLKEALKSAQDKYDESLPLEERIDSFIKAFPSLDSRAKGKVFYEWHHTLTGSCRMGRDEFCKSHGVDLDKTYSVLYFLQLVKNDYGSEAIRQVIERYVNNE